MEEDPTQTGWGGQYQRKPNTKHNDEIMKNYISNTTLLMAILAFWLLKGLSRNLG